MDDQEQVNHERDLKVAKNEAKRELVSDVRLSTWAMSITIVLGLVVLLFYMMRK